MKNALNLLPAAYRRQRLARRRAIQWSLALLATVSMIFLTRSYQVRQYHALQQQLQAISREGRPAQAMLHEIATMRKNIDQLHKHQTVAQELEQQRHVLTLLGAVSTAAQATGGRLRLTEYRVADLQATADSETGSDDASHPGTVTLIGVALDSPTVAEFHDSLVQSGLFADVKLIKSNEQHAMGTELYEYEVRCEL